MNGLLNGSNIVGLLGIVQLLAREKAVFKPVPQVWRRRAELRPRLYGSRCFAVKLQSQQASEDSNVALLAGWDQPIVEDNAGAMSFIGTVAKQA